MEVNVVLIDDNKVNRRHLVEWLTRVKPVKCENDVVTFRFHSFRPENSREDPRRIDVDATLKKALALEPGVAVIDLRLNGNAGNDYSGAALSLRIKAACNDCCIILVSYFFDEAPRLLDDIEIFRFRVDRNQSGYGKELQKQFKEAVRHHVSAIALRQLLNTPVTPGPHAKQSPSRAVYISYARDDQGDIGSSREEIVNRIERSLLRHGYDARRDTRNLGYTGLISAFMKEIGAGGCVVAVLSEKYLRSQFCMYELLEVHRNQDFHKRLCPIVLPDARLISIGDRRPYVNYWLSQFQEVQRLYRKIRLADVALEELNEVHRYRDISQEAGRLLAFIADMNYSTPEELEKDDFAILRKRIDECLK